jgi:group I intron endonuclease
MFLYVITNLVNGKQYVGITRNVEQRRREHYSGHGSTLVRQAIRKYGKEHLQFEVWYEGDDAWIKTMEYRAIVMLGTRTPQGYNLTLGGEGSVGWRPSAETRMKMSKSRSGHRNGMFGRTHSEETRSKIRTRATGRKLHAKTLAMLTDVAGAKNPRARPVAVDGIAYGCTKDAARATGLNVNTLYARLRRYARSGLWPVGWGFKAPV